MKCLVCDHDIRVDSLKQLFALQPLLLCCRCSQNLIPKSADVLYSDNDWIRTVIEKLNRGDLALIQLFKNDLQSALSKKGAVNSKIKIIEAKQDLPYPWLEILVSRIGFVALDGSLMPPADSIVVAVEKQENTHYQIAIID